MRAVSTVQTGDLPTGFFQTLVSGNPAGLHRSEPERAQVHDPHRLIVRRLDCDLVDACPGKRDHAEFLRLVGMPIPRPLDHVGDGLVADLHDVMTAAFPRQELVISAAKSPGSATLQNQVTKDAGSDHHPMLSTPEWFSIRALP